MITLGSLFAVAFLAATFLPFSSEIYFLALLVQGVDPYSLVFWASLGNTLGAAVNWGIGWYARGKTDWLTTRSWLRISAADINRAGRGFQRYGIWSLLLSWVPIVGDALTLFAGLARIPLWQLILLAGAGKTLRYLSLAGFLSELL